MSLRLLIDEDSQSKRLVSVLRDLKHDVLTINDVEMAGTPDVQVLAFATTENRILLTRNCQDFEDLHRSGVDHAGILAIYQEKDRRKEMTRRDIGNAIQNLEKSGVELNKQFIKLNAWRY